MSQSTHYGYEYICPYSGLVDYVGIGHENGNGNKGRRMKSHLKRTTNRMLASKLQRLADNGVAPQYRKVVEGMTRDEVYDWETSRIFEIGRLRDGTGPLFNVALLPCDRKLTAFGSTFPSFDALCRAEYCVVSGQVLEYRIAAGWSPEAAASTPEETVCAFEQRYPSLRELHEDYRCVVPYETLLTRSLKGESPEQAACRPLQWVGAWGERFPTLESLSGDPRCLSSPETLVREVKRGCEHEAAALSARGSVRFRDRIYPNLRELTQIPECVVSQGVFLERLQCYGWTVERALTEPITYELYGKTYKTAEEMSRHPLCKYDAETVHRRLMGGCYPEAAIGAWLEPKFTG